LINKDVSGLEKKEWINVVRQVVLNSKKRGVFVTRESIPCIQRPKINERPQLSYDANQPSQENKYKGTFGTRPRTFATMHQVMLQE